MNLIKSLTRALSPSRLTVLISILSSTTVGVAQSNAPLPVINISADKVVAKMPPTFYGLMTKEINYTPYG